jgi:hypothetical protein
MMVMGGRTARLRPSVDVRARPRSCKDWCVPTFCRHNRFIQNCPICSREQEVQLREVVSPRAGAPGAPRQRASRATGATRRSTGVRVRQLARDADDGFHSRLVPGLRSSTDAQRLASEVAFAVHRLSRLGEDPPGLYAEVAGPGDLEERSWLAFLIAYLGPLEDGDPFAAIREARTAWSSGDAPALADVARGPRGVQETTRGEQTIAAYRAWALRAGSQAAGFGGEPSWTPERRFARVYERLVLPGLPRHARFDLLVTLGRLGCYELRPGTLVFGGENEVTLAAKRALGIGDPLLLERRAFELADAGGVPLEALDVGFFNWGSGRRATLGLFGDDEPDPAALASLNLALGL